MEPQVSATHAAIDAMGRLEEIHGPLVFHQSGGCCEGSSPMCLGRDELPPGPGDELLGEIGHTPFYVDSDQYERWRRPRLLLDVADGAAEGFSLEGSLGVRFLIRDLEAEAADADGA